MSGRVQNQLCKGTLKDKRENVHFVVDRDNIVNRGKKKNGSMKRLSIFKSKTILIEDSQDMRVSSCHAPPKTLQLSPYRAVHDLVLAYIYISCLTSLPPPS